MVTPLYVPDASVILKWAFASPDEQGRDSAVKLLQQWLDGGCEFLLPSLWVYEVGNVLGLKAPDSAGEYLSIFTGYQFSECPMGEDLCREALRLMKNFGVTFYDAAYHAVALVYGGTFVTADAAYHRKAGKAGAIALLSDTADSI